MSRDENNISKGCIELNNQEDKRYIKNFEQAEYSITQFWSRLGGKLSFQGVILEVGCGAVRLYCL